MIPGRSSVLYTSLSREGAIAEIRYHWSLLSPPPTKPATVHELAVSTLSSVRISKTDFAALGISVTDFASRNYRRCQEAGAAAAFLGFDSLIVPPARSECEHLILIMDNHQFDEDLHVVSSQPVDLKL